MTTKTESTPKGLELLRKPFKDNQIGKLPKPTGRQTEAVKNNSIRAIKCNLCGGWHHPDAIHLDYVGHAALTDRLLDVDPAWNWEPFSTTETGAPEFDNQGGLWIRLTILGVTRLGYGATNKRAGGDAVKEIIGDALRNAAMRFGAALDLWHIGDLHLDIDPEEPEAEPDKPKNPPVDIETLKKSSGMAFLRAFKTIEEALETARMSNYVSPEAEKEIRDIYAAAHEEKSNGDS